MIVTVVICTWNRAALLDRTLSEMRHLRVPEGVEWELLVVNNNCTDDTDEVLRRHAVRLPLRRLFEPRPGHSNARNCAVGAATGELVLWTDDDVLVDPDWLAEYVRAARAWPDAAFFGGTIDPWFGSTPPGWLPPHLGEVGGVFAIRQLGPEVRPLAPFEEIYGASFAVRMDVMRDFRFDPDLGRIGDGMMSGDETDVVSRLRGAGRMGVWVGTSRVRHYIPGERLTVGYLWAFYHGLGRTILRRGGVPEGKRIRGCPRWLIRAYGEHRIRLLGLRLVNNPRWVRELRQTAILGGMVAECFSIGRKSTPPRSSMSA